jgi:hypothetical protein
MSISTHTYRFTLPLLLFLACGAALHAQSGTEHGVALAPDGGARQSALRVGVHAGVETNLLRYQVWPYAGEFQAITDESTAFGISMQLPLEERWSLRAEITRVRHTWAIHQDGDPQFSLRRIEHARYELPLLLVYRPPVPVIPLYVAAGPEIMLATKTDGGFVLTYTSFSERGGWKENEQRFDHTALRLAAVGEIGLDLPLSRVLSMQLAMRFTHPFAPAVDEDALRIRDFSYWRLHTGLLLRL